MPAEQQTNDFTPPPENGAVTTPPKFAWKTLIQLLVVVTILAGVIIGGSALINGSRQDDQVKQDRKNGKAQAARLKAAIPTAKKLAVDGKFVPVVTQQTLAAFGKKMEVANADIGFVEVLSKKTKYRTGGVYLNPTGSLPNKLNIAIMVDVYGTANDSLFGISVKAPK